MPNQVNATQLTPNATIYVKGKLAFSRLAKLIDGEDLAKVDNQRRQNKMIPVGRPHTSVTLANAEVLFANPNAPTLEEAFVAERRYTSKQADQGLCYSMDNKSPNLPIVGVQNPADGTVEQVVLESDLAAGIEVTLVLRVYKPQGHLNCGLALDLVLLHEPVRYYNGGVNAEELKKRGIIFTTPPKQVSGVEAAASAAAVAPAAAADPAAYLPAGTDPATLLPAPAPAVAAVPATPPVLQPAPVAAAAPAVAPAPVAAVAPAVQQFETQEQELARLRAESAARSAASAASGGESAFGSSPWVDPQQEPVAANGIAFTA